MITPARFTILDTEISKSLYAKYPPKRPEFDSYNNLLSDWFIICAAWKSLTDKAAKTVSILDDPDRFEESPTDDYHVCKVLHEVLSETDVLIGHGMKKFDWPKIQARLLYHGFPPLAKPRILDTRDMAKSLGEFTSTSLDYLTKYLKLPQKKDNRGNEMWNDVVRYAFQKDLAALEEVIVEVVEYCIPDVYACEGLYNYLLPYVEAKHRANFSDGHQCGACNSKKLQKRGLTPPNVTGSRYQRYQCQKCGAWGRDKKAAVLTDIR